MFELLVVSRNLSNDVWLPGEGGIVSLGTPLEQDSLVLHQPPLHKALVPEVASPKGRLQWKGLFAALNLSRDSVVLREQEESIEHHRKE